MRVIITSPSFDATQNVSGMAAVVNFIATENTRYKYTHFTLGKRDDEARNHRWLLRIMAGYVKWIYMMLLNQHALIHFNLAFDRRGLLRDSPLILVARLLRRRLIIHIHGGEFITGENMPRWLRVVVKCTLAGSRIIVLSKLEQTMLVKSVRNAKIVVLPNCIRVDEAEAFYRSYTGGDEPLKVLFLGRIAISKGIGDIYLAMAALKEKHTYIKFIIAGAGPDERVYVRQFQELLGATFEFRGVVAGPDKTKLLRECSVFLLPSLFEGMPMALLETMAFGLVPIVTSVGAMPSVVADGRNGIVVDRQCPEGIVDAVSKLVEDKEFMKTLSQQARQDVLANCRPDVYFEQLNSLYQVELSVSI